MLDAPNYDIVRTIGSGAFGTAIYTQAMSFRPSIAAQERQ